MASPEPLLSTRVSLRWPPAPAFEDTDTMVLVGRSGFFVDLRVFITGEKKGEIDWASAGWKKWIEEDGAGGDVDQDHPKASFTPLFDSRSLPPLSSTLPTFPQHTPPADIGTFHPISSTDVLETGEMLNPDLGHQHPPQPYEEVWRRLPMPEEAGKTRVLMLQSEDKRAFIGRVGAIEIGVGWEEDDADGNAVVWAWRNDDGEDVYVVEEEVGRKYRVPPEDLYTGLDAKPGEVVALGGKTWVVVESS